jgi:SAM-dependent methyltransferase
VERDEYRRMAEVEDRHWWYSATRALLSDLLDDSLVPGAVVLDAGAGTGATGAWMATRPGVRVVSSDFDGDGLSLHRELHPDIAALAAADIQHLPFASSSFDLALCVTVLCHRSIPRPAVAVAELARVVKPGGIVCLWEPGVRRLRRAHDRVTHTARRFSVRDLRDLLRDNGLTVERSTGAHSYLVPAAAAKAVLERGVTSSDLDEHQDGLGGVLGRAASVERAVLRRTSLPFGLSAVAVGRVRHH